MPRVQALREAAAGHDLILTSGGVSVGEEDHIKPAVQQLGSLDLWQIAMKPGKPFAYGTVGRRALHRPAGQSGLQLRHLPAAGAAVPAASCRARRGLRRRPCTLPRALRLAARRTSAASSCACGAMRQGGLELFPNQSSGVLTSTVWADGLVDIAPGQTIAHGDLVRFLPLAELLHESARSVISPRSARPLGQGSETLRDRAATTLARCATNWSRAASPMPRRWRAARPCAWRSTRYERRIRALREGCEVAFFPPVTGG